MTIAHSQETSASTPPREINLDNTERLVSGGLGAFLVLNGLKRFSLGGLIEAGIGAALVNRGLTGHCHVYEALGVNRAGEGAPPEEYFHRGIHVEETFTINKPADELFAFWRNFENLPKFMHNLEAVEVRDGKRSRWVAKGPAGKSVDWEAEIINEVPNELIGWRSIDGSEVDNAGSVHFTPATGGRGTEVKVVLRYDPPAGKLGARVSKILGEDPATNVQEDLRRLKMLIETGEIATTEGQPTGR